MLITDRDEDIVPNICCLVGFQDGLMLMDLCHPVTESSGV